MMNNWGGLIVMNQDKNWELTESGVEALALMDQLNKKIGNLS